MTEKEHGEAAPTKVDAGRRTALREEWRYRVKVCAEGAVRRRVKTRLILKAVRGALDARTV
jgi:hypothetical protein